MGQFVTVHGNFVDMNDTMISNHDERGYILSAGNIGLQYVFIIGKLCLGDNLGEVGSQTFYSYSNLPFGIGSISLSTCLNHIILNF